MISNPSEYEPLIFLDWYKNIKITPSKKFPYEIVEDKNATSLDKDAAIKIETIKKEDKDN